MDSDFRDTRRILADVVGVLDFSQPVAEILLGMLHYIPDEDDPAGIVER